MLQTELDKASLPDSIVTTIGGFDNDRRTKVVFGVGKGADSPICLKKTPGSGAEPQPAAAGELRDSRQLPVVPELLIGERRLSNSV